MNEHLITLRPFQMLGLRTLRLLRLAPRTYNELADSLCICRLYAEQVVHHLRKSGFIIHSHTESRKKYFRTAAKTDLLPTVLTKAEQKELAMVLTGNNLHLQTAFYKLTQLLNA